MIPVLTSLYVGSLPDEEDESSPESLPNFWIFNGVFYQTAQEANKRLAPGIYGIYNGSNGFGLSPIPKSGDGDAYVPINDPAINRIHSEINSFKGKREAYIKFGVAYKRGFIMHGTPGCGKTMALRQLQEKSVKDGFIVLSLSAHIHPGLIRSAFDLIRSIEPNRMILLTIEDFDSYERRNEDEWLEFFDGVGAFDNFITVITTNDISVFPDRLAKRPSRFDVVVEFNHLDWDGRFQFIQHKAPDFSEANIKSLASLTDGMSMAIIKEVLILIQIFDHTIEEAIEKCKRFLQ